MALLPESSRSWPKTSRRSAPRTGEDLVDPFVEVGQHVAIEARVAIHHLWILAERLVVVGRGIDGDPVLTEFAPTISSAESAWPMWDPNLCTPGIARRSRPAA